MTHDELIGHVERWAWSNAWALQPSHRARIACTEPLIGGESPDVFFWGGGDETYTVECKVSRSDWLADRRKAHNMDNFTLGKYRICAAPDCLISRDEAKGRGMGLLTFDDEGNVTLYDPPKPRNAMLDASRNITGELMLAMRGWRKAQGDNRTAGTPPRQKARGIEGRVVELLNTTPGDPWPAAAIARELDIKMSPAKLSTIIERIPAVCTFDDGGLRMFYVPEGTP